MKARRTIPKIRRVEDLLEPARDVKDALEPTCNPDIFPYGLNLIEEILPFLGVGPAPSAMDCEDLSCRAYQISDAIAQFIELGEKGLEADNSYFGSDNPLPWLVGTLRFHIQIARLAAKTLHNLHRNEEQSTAARSRKTA